MNLRAWLTRTYLTIGFWLFILAAPVTARVEVISMETSVGFDGFVQLDKWTPVTVVLENRGRSVSGVLELQVTSGSEYLNDVYQTTYARELALPYGSRKRCAFTILLRSVAHDVVIRFREGATIHVSAAVNLKRKVIDRDVALVLDDTVSPDFQSSLPPRLFPIRISAHRLPNTWYGYDGVRMLIVNPALLKRLEDRQFQALKRWVGRGGYLIISAGINYGSLKEDRMKQLMSVTISGHHRLFDQTALEVFSEKPWRGPEPMFVVDAEVDDSEIVAAADGIPLVVQKKMAYGRMVFLSFDIQSPVFNRWAGRQDFWKEIILRAPPKEKIRDVISDRQIADALLSGMPVTFPPLWLAASFLLAYAAGIGTLLKKAEKKKEYRRKCVTMLLLGIALFSMAGGFYFFQKSRMNPSTFNSFSVLAATGRDLSGFGKYILGVYTIKRAELRVGFRGSPYPISHLLTGESDKKIPNPYTIIDAPVQQQVRIDSRKWSYNLFETTSQKTLPISAHAVLKSGNLRLSIENNTRHAIQNGLIYYRNRFFPVDPIASLHMNTLTIDRYALDTDAVGAEKDTAAMDVDRLIERIEQKADPSFLNLMTRRLMKDVVSKTRSTYPSDSRHAVFIGWIAFDIMEPHFDNPAIQGEGITLFSWEIPIE